MAWRAIQDSTSKSRTLSALSDFAERLFWRMLSETDPWGRLDGDPVKLAACCIPMLPERWEEVTAALEELQAVGRVVIYGDPPACQLVDFDRHQVPTRLDRRSRFGSRFPEPPQATVENAHAAREALYSKTPANHLPADSDSDRESDILERQSEVVCAAELPERKHDGPSTWASVAASLADADERTPAVISAVARGLPQAALHTALESLELRRRTQPPLVSEARYFVATLQRMREERQYA